MTAFWKFLPVLLSSDNQAANAGARLRSRSSQGQAIRDIAAAACAGWALAVSVTVVVIAVHSFEWFNAWPELQVDKKLNQQRKKMQLAFADVLAAGMHVQNE
ncbi:UNVERIFIED_CONTAM: hypothetical protein NO986_18505 [Comamonas sp. A-3]|uniref:hypothetical protein n=1 Tax=Comamonas TaxID=283 RepID=UPI0015CAD6DD|nr:hypothetical protein [Comamonas thiooxydans]MDH1476798.1 hypothetical protein [Comamonas thiooxydans]